MNHDYVPLTLPDIGPEEIAEVVSTLKSGWLTTGERTARFEEEFRAYSGARHALAVNSCTAALHLSLVALGIGPGDEVITTPLTFCATVNAILHVGATPVLADVGEDGNIDPREVEKQITSRTAALLPVHLAGLPCDMEALWDLADRHGLKVIEDAAHAAGTFYKGRHLGGASSRSDTVSYSFYATKNMTTGEGGMVTCNDAELASRMRMLSLHGIGRDAWKRHRKDGSWFYEVMEPGFKYNMGDLQSAIGIHQLRKLERFIQVRTKHANLYRELLGDIEELELPTDAANGRHAWHLFMLRLRTEQLRISRNEFIECLRGQNIGTSVHFIPIPLHPFFAASTEMRNASTAAIALYHRLISLPLYPSLTEDQIHRVCAAVRRTIVASRKPAVAARIAG